MSNSSRGQVPISPRAGEPDLFRIVLWIFVIMWVVVMGIRMFSPNEKGAPNVVGTETRDGSVRGNRGVEVPPPERGVGASAREERAASRDDHRQLKRYVRMQVTGRLDKIRQRAGLRYDGSRPHQEEMRWMELAERFPALYKQYYEEAVNNREIQMATGNRGEGVTEVYSPSEWATLKEYQEEMRRAELDQANTKEEREEIETFHKMLEEHDAMPMF